MIFLLIALLRFPVGLVNDYSIDEFYKKVELGDGTLSDDGDEIEFIFVKSEMKQGRYEIEITDGPGDLYEIKGIAYFIKFRSYFGYAGYGTKGLLSVGTSAWSSKFIKYD